MLGNFYRQFLELLPDEPLEVGDVVARFATGCTVRLLSGAYVQARGAAELGERVYVRGGAIEGPAPNLPGTTQYV